MKKDLKLSLLGVSLEVPTRRLLFLGLILPATVLLYFLWPISSLAESLQRGVFYFSLITSVLLLFYGLRSVKGRESAGLLSVFLPAFFGCAILFLHADFGFKVSMDDAILSASAKSLYESQEYYVGIQGQHGIEGYELIDGYFDKRPWFYSFCVAVLHYLSGWRIENAFIANALFGVAFVIFITSCGRQLGGASGAWIAALLAASLPMVAQNATGGGMDMANAALLALLFLLAAGYLNNPGEVTEGALLSAAILLAYTRYESLLYVFPAFVIVVIGWVLRGRASFSLPTIALAPLLLPVLLQNRYFRNTETLWELQSSVQSPFSVAHLAENFPRALHFLFNFSDTLPNSVAVSAIGIISALWILVWALRHSLTKWSEHRGVVCWAIITAAVVINFLILMAYHDGKLDKIFASRLALPLSISLILAPSAVIGLGQFSRRTCGILVFIISIYILGWTLPANSRELFTKRNYVQNELDWLMEAVAPDVLNKDLVIDEKSTPWALYEKQVLRPRVALENLEVLARRQARGAYENIYYIERVEYVYDDGALKLEPSRLPEGVLELRPLMQRSFRPFSVIRVNRVSGIDPDRLPEDFFNRPPHGQRQDYDFDGL